MKKLIALLLTVLMCLSLCACGKDNGKTDEVGSSTVRMIPCCIAFGQAAGIAAAQAIQSGKTPATIDVQALRDELRRQGAAPADAALLAEVWQGRIGCALACLTGERRALFDAAFSVCRCVAANDAYGLMKLFIPYEKERESLQTLLADAVQILRGSLAGAQACPVPADAAVPAIRAVLDAAARLRGNGNARLVLTGLCLQLGE